MYSSLAKTAIAKWSDVDEPYAKDYHQSGTLILSSTAHATAAHYVRSAFDLNDGAVPLETAEKMRDCFPSTLLEKGAFVDQVAYFNPNCGYTTARSAMDALCDRVRQSGVKFLQGQATRILYDSPTSLDDSHDDITKRTVVGVELASGKMSVLLSQFFDELADVRLQPDSGLVHHLGRSMDLDPHPRAGGRPVGERTSRRHNTIDGGGSSNAQGDASRAGYGYRFLRLSCWYSSASSSTNR